MAREIGQELRKPTILIEDLGSFPSTHMVAHNCVTSVPGIPIPSFGLSVGTAHIGCTYINTSKTFIYIHTHKVKIIYFLEREQMVQAFNSRTCGQRQVGYITDSRSARAT